MVFVNFVNYTIIMNKKINNTENEAQIISKEDLSLHNEKGIYMRDDHCDWGSSGMNEFTNEFSEDK